AAVEAHPLFRRISMLEGSSIDPDIVAKVHEAARDRQRVLVCLDSHHIRDHVLAELVAYAPLVTPGSYCVAFDTIIEELPEGTYPARPWAPGNGPLSATRAFLATPPEFRVDETIDNKLLISVSPRGYLKRLG